MAINFNRALIALLVAATVNVAPALARGNDLVIKNGSGERVEIKNGFFGRKTTSVQDRLGNGYKSETGLFGSKDTSVSVMGNSFNRKKGIFGSTEVQGNTIFGDKVTTRKGLFGRRTTEVDISGTSGVVKNLWNKYGADLMGKSSAPAPLPVNPGDFAGNPADLSSSF